eukprot:gene8452-5930_t
MADGGWAVPANRWDSAHTLAGARNVVWRSTKRRIGQTVREKERHQCRGVCFSVWCDARVAAGPTLCTARPFLSFLQSVCSALEPLLAWEESAAETSVCEAGGPQNASLLEDAVGEVELNKQRD